MLESGNFRHNLSPGVFEQMRRGVETILGASVLRIMCDKQSIYVSRRQAALGRSGDLVTCSMVYGLRKSIHWYGHVYF